MQKKHLYLPRLARRHPVKTKVDSMLENARRNRRIYIYEGNE